MSLQLRKPILFSAVWKYVWPEGQRKWFPLSAPVTPALKYGAELWDPQQKDIDMLEQVQRRDAKRDRGIKHLSYEKKAENFSLGKRKLCLIAAFQ